MSDQPRGIRNNNPLNIDHHATNQWRGLADPPSDGRFCRFTEPQWGVRAAIIILRSYAKRGVRSLRAIIGTWAPPHENSVESYLGHVVRKTGLTQDTILDLANKDQVIAVLKAMCEVECGPAPQGTANGSWLDDAVWEAGWSLANPLTKSRTTVGSVASVAATVAGVALESVIQAVPEAATTATLIKPIWPEVAQWTLVGIAIAGALLAAYARWQARQEGVR